MSFSSVTEINSHWSLTTEEFINRLTFRLSRDGSTVAQFNFLPTTKWALYEYLMDQLDIELRRLNAKPEVRHDVAFRALTYFSWEVL